MRSPGISLHQRKAQLSAPSLTPPRSIRTLSRRSRLWRAGERCTSLTRTSSIHSSRTENQESGRHSRKGQKQAFNQRKNNMMKTKRTALAIALVALIGTTTFAQRQEQSSGRPSAATVTGAIAVDRVRFAGAGNITSIRLELYDEAGIKLFDSRTRAGNILDWSREDGQQQQIADGTYLCVVTVQSLSGKVSRKLATITLREQTNTLQPTEAAQLTPAQTQALSPAEGDPALESTPLTIIADDQAIAATVIAHDGKEGQITRTKGALTFRVGDFFSGNDKEQMRLTEDGRLGIGTDNPQATLDVAGTVRASKGIEFADGTVQTTGLSGRKDKDGNVVPNAAGSGTQGRLAKWTDNAGTLGDSVALDTGTSLQLTAAPSAMVDTNLLYLNSTNGTTGMLAGSTPSFGANNGPFFAMRGNNYTTIATGNIASPVGDDGSIKFNTGNDQLRMVIRPSGNVGIGTTSPGSKLHVAGGAAAQGIFGSTDAGAFAGGVHGFSTGLNGKGVIGEANNGTLAYGVWGQSTDGRGVYGSTNNGTGVYGFNANDTSGFGVEGLGFNGVKGVSSTNGSGVVGATHGNGTAVTAIGGGAGGTGLYAQGPLDGYSAYLEGPARIVAGDLTILDHNVCANNIPCSSDARLKRGITNLNYGLRHILQLRPVSWAWKDKTDSNLKLGLIAQEVEPIMPELILREKDPAKPLGLNYIGFVPVMIKAVQEQQTTINALKKENAVLQRQNAALNVRLAALEQVMQRKFKALSAKRRPRSAARGRERTKL